MQKYLLYLILFTCHSYIFPQFDSSLILNDKIFQLLEDAEEENEDGQLFEIIEELLLNPINLNEASLTDLIKIPFLTSLDAKQILSKRKELNHFSSISDLEKIKIDQNTLILIKPFVKIGKPRTTEKNNNLQYYIRSRVKNDLQNRVGFINGNYLGNKQSLYNRILLKNQNMRIGLLSEKDAGENDYLDHYTGFFEYQSNGLINKVIFGDYNIEFGQGLAMWSAYSFSKGLDAVNPVMKRTRNISAHLSSEENRHFRGSAISLNLPSNLVTLFYSSNSISAVLDNSSDISNFYRSGYYRTESELSKKNNLGEIVAGITTSMNIAEILDIGILHYQVNYDRSFALVNTNKLIGSKFSFTSLSYNILINDINVNGEIAYNGVAYSTITNINLKINSNIGLLASYRNYSPQYYNIFSNGFGEYGNTQNEVGYYLGGKIKTPLGYLNIYYDIFRSFSESFFSDFPTSGSDFLIYYDLKVSRSLQFGIKYKWEVKEKQVKLNLNELLIDESKSNYRVEIKYKLNKFINGKSRIELVNFASGDEIESGFLSFQELKLAIPKHFSISSRIIFFDSDSYNSRLYEFENDVRGVMSNFPLFGEGFRWYFLFSYSPFNNFSISAKYSETYKPNEKIISSGNAQIVGNLDNRLNLQIDYGF